ncbi:hypothetical protein BLNAU_15623 [Blattamonas nauphoetae]|uniref:Uncharacterized protein n=1 Tax=Blattamonas nauphoetae TaxID=2049346 RepID=A0ABQ9XDQ1_9EUKA|nr:hypothetical protein BLNAU_15623 [Blattamonas nauphoetae]
MMTFFFSDDNHSNKSTFFPEKFAIEHLWSNLNQWVEISRIFSSSTPQVSPRIHFLLLMKEHPEPPPKPIKFEVKETQTTQQTSNSTTETMPVKRKVRRLPPAPPRPSNIRWVPSPGKTTPSGLDLHLTGRLTPKQMHELSVTHKFDKYDRTLDSTRKSRTST